jgi:outer membrane immunogenic protein
LIALAGAIGGSNLALAADLKQPVYKAPLPPPAPAFSWTGIYFGGNVGGAWRQDNVTDSLTSLSFSTGSNNGTFMGGGQVGYNYQINNLVLGVEGDFDWAGNNNNAGNGVVITGPLGLGHTFVASVNDKWITTLAARLGIAYDHWLFYMKGGGGWVANNGVTITDVTTGTSLTGFNSNSTSSGWLLGGGIEYAFTNNWTVKVEYDYLGLGNRTFTLPVNLPVLPGDAFTSSSRNIQMVKVGINYLFNTAEPVVAKY